MAHTQSHTSTHTHAHARIHVYIDTALTYNGAPSNTLFASLVKCHRLNSQWAHYQNEIAAEI